MLRVICFSLFSLHQFEKKQLRVTSCVSSTTYPVSSYATSLSKLKTKIAANLIYNLRITFGSQFYLLFK